MDILNSLWSLAEKILLNISRVWEWLNTTLRINLGLKIPIIFPDGINFDFGYTPLELLGVGILVLIGLWLVKSLIPMG